MDNQLPPTQEPKPSNPLDFIQESSNSAPNPGHKIIRSMSVRYFATIAAVIILSAIVLKALGVDFDNSKTKQQPAVTQTAKPSPTSAPTAGWKTYTNTKYGYSIKYPSNYSLPEGQGDRFAIMSPQNATFSLQEDELKIEIFTETSPSGDTLEIILSEQKAEMKKILSELEPLEGPADVKEVKIVTINGMRAVHRATSQSPINFDIYTFIHNQKRIYIAKYPLVTSRQNEFDQILSTFKFTK